MADNKQIAQDVLKAVGGPENVSNVVHCMTRLRFTLKDKTVPNDDEVKKITHTDLVTILKSLDQELVKGAIAGERFREYFFANCKDEKIAACVKELL